MNQLSTTPFHCGMFAPFDWKYDNASAVHSGASSVEVASGRVVVGVEFEREALREGSEGRRVSDEELSTLVVGIGLDWDAPESCVSKQLSIRRQQMQRKARRDCSLGLLIAAR